MTDILIRDVAESDLRRIDEKAANAGISRTEYLRRLIAEDARRPLAATTLRATDFAKFADLADDELMTAAWQ